MFGDVGAATERAPVTLEVFDEITAELKSIHDVGEFGGVLEAEGMARALERLHG